MKKIGIALAVVFAASSVLVFAQAEQVKKRAKDLKRDVETKQTNGVPATNAPARK